MKKRKYIFLLIILIVLIIFAIFNTFNKSKLTYIRNESNLNTFYFQDNMVIFDCDIIIKNNTKKDIEFYMDADISNELGLTKDSIAIGYNKNTKKRVFFIEENSQKNFEVEFKALKGDKKEKSNRLPPKDIIIKIKN